MATRELKVNIVGDASSLEKALGKSAQHTETFGTKLQKASLVAGAAIAGGLAVGLEKSVKAAEDAETSQARLAQAYKTSGLILDAYTGQISQVTDAGRKLGFTNTEQKDALGSLIIATHSQRKAVEDLSVAEDIARFKHVDLTTGTKALTMAMGGSQRAIKQLGLSIQPATDNMDALTAAHKKSGTAITSFEKATAKAADKQETASKVIDLVRQKLGGQAKAYADTSAGGMAQFHAQTQNLEEEMGKGLLPAVVAVTEKLSAMMAFFANHTTTAKVLVGALAALAATLITIGIATRAYAAASEIARAATVVWTAVQWALNVALDANPIGIVIIAIAALVAGIILAWKHSETFRRVVTAAFDAVKTAATFVLNFFRDNWKIIAAIILAPFLPIVAAAYGLFKIKDAIIGAAEAILGFFRDHWKIIAVIISGPFAPLVALATNAFGIRSALVGAFGFIVDGVRDKVGALIDLIAGIGGRALHALGNLSHLLYNAGVEIIQGLINGITAKLGELWGLVGGIAGKIAGLKGPIEKDSELLKPHGQAIIEGLMGGIQARLPDLEKLVSGIAPSLSSTLGDVTVPVGTASAASQGVSSSVGIASPAVAGSAGLMAEITIPVYIGAEKVTEVVRREMLRFEKRNGRTAV